MKQNEMNTFRVPQSYAACCILHNSCEVHGDAFVETWLDGPQLLQPSPVAAPCSNSLLTIQRKQGYISTVLQYTLNQ